MNDKSGQVEDQGKSKKKAQVGEEEILENTLNAEDEDSCEISEIREEMVGMDEQEEVVEEDDENGEDEDESSEDVNVSTSLDKLLIEDLPAKVSDYCFKIFGGKSVNLKIDDDSYNLNFQSKNLEVQKREVDKCDLLVEIASDTFYKIIRRKLNPQIALVNCQVKASGDQSLLVYFFNLFSRTR